MENIVSYNTDDFMTPRKEESSRIDLALDVLKEGTVAGLKQRWDEVKAEPVKTLGLQVGLPVAAGAGLALMSRFPIGSTIAKGVGAVMLAGAAIDGISRLGTAAYSAYDTARNPENYYANKEAVAGSLGTGLFDYGVLGLAAYKATSFLTERMMAASIPTGRSMEARLAQGRGSMDEFSKTNAVFEAASHMSNESHVAIPQYLHGMNSKEATVMMADRTSFLGKMYTNSREAVVKISVSGNGPNSGSGSGFFVDADGTLVTNYHVVRGARNVQIKTADGQSYWARFLARDKLADLAVLQVLNKPADFQFPHLELGNTAALPKGAGLIAVGHPIGVPQEVLALGQLKGHGVEYTPFRGSPIEAPVAGKPTRLLVASDLVTNLPIKGGYSGSPLLDSQGKVVGVLKAEAGEISVATSVEHLRALMGQVQSRSPINGWLDVRSYYDVNAPQWAPPSVRIARVQQMEGSDWTLASKIRGQKVVKPKTATQFIQID